MEDKQTKTLWRWFWAWDESKCENWFEEMSRQGWHLKKSRFFAYTFEKGKKKEYIYKMDYYENQKQNQMSHIEDYIQIFSDAGWEHIDNTGAWHYFRTEKDLNKSLDIYTDNPSKIQKYKQLYNFYLLIFLLCLFNLINFFLNPILGLASFRWIQYFYYFIITINVFAILILGYGIYKYQQRIKKLKEKI